MKQSTFSDTHPRALQDHDQNSHKRLWLNWFMGNVVRVGGISVLLAVALIFFYLLYIVLPLLKPASLNLQQQFPLPAPQAGNTLILTLDERGELATRLTDRGQAVFFTTDRSPASLNAAEQNVTLQQLPWPQQAAVTAHYFLNDKGIAVFGFANGQALVVHNRYVFHYKDGASFSQPQLDYPLGAELLNVSPGDALRLLNLQSNDQQTMLVALTQSGRLLIQAFSKEENFLSGEVELTQSHWELSLPPSMQVQHLALDGAQRYLYLADNEGNLFQYSIADTDNMRVLHSQPLQDAAITQLQMLLGGISLLVGQADGQISQWFPVRNDTDGEQYLQRIRDFSGQSTAINAILPEQRRKGFIAVAADNSIGIYHSTAHRLLRVTQTASQIQQLALSPRADRLLIETDSGDMALWHIDNPHPEISWSSLWGKVWYESHSEAKYLWQSSSASEDAEPKFSLTPLAIGTLKASFYALLFAIPLAVLGGIYTAHFMSPKLRSWVKPSIELMEALPTVILGFLAGLWMAPLVEKNLPGVFAVFFIVPLGVLLVAGLWHSLPRRWTAWLLPEGWHVVLLLPMIACLVWLALSASFSLEQWLFAGNVRQWLNQNGIDFDQRNAIVVGFAMGFAIIPTIFSMTEDAVSGVPKHLTLGSLALGATPWQTMLRVVLLTASPGIFSAIMIGMGRAVGETMIVLMATGNTPIVDFNIFTGMRTLAANIAIEMPESETHGTHYRVLFLAALVLFIFTLFINTLTEIVRQRLRKNYSDL